MGIEKITNRISSDAEAKANDIMEKARAESAKMMAEAEAEKERLVVQADARGKSEKEKIISQKKAVADIDGRKYVLSRKQQLIDDCFKEAENRIAEMDRDKYLGFLLNTVKTSGAKKCGRIEILLNDRDKKEVGEALINELKKEFPESDFVLSDEKRKFKGGLLIKQGKVYINGTIENFIDEAKEESAQEIAKVLFQ